MYIIYLLFSFFVFFFFNDTATTEIYTLSLHDALPISLFSKTLLGSEGAFEKAGDGVIFLDKLDSMPFECHSQLLALLEKNVFQYAYRPKINIKTPKIICSVSKIGRAHV